jgi:uncharacterized protein involved in propanediol utilization
MVNILIDRDCFEYGGGKYIYIYGDDPTHSVVVTKSDVQIILKAFEKIKENQQFSQKKQEYDQKMKELEKSIEEANQLKKKLAENGLSIAEHQEDEGALEIKDDTENNNK